MKTKTNPINRPAFSSISRNPLKSKPLFASAWSFAFALVVLVFLFGETVHATNFTWTDSALGVVDGPGTWNTTGSNWWDSVIADPAWSGTDIAVFGYGTGDTVSTGTAGTITITAPVSVGGIIFQNAYSGGYTIASANSSDTLSISGTVSINGNYNPTISAVVSGSGFTLFDANGTNGFTLSGSNNYSGTLLVTNNSNSSNYFALYATEGIGLSTSANVEIYDNDARSVGNSYGFVLAASGTFSRAIGTGADQVQFLGTNPGISANGAPLTVNFGGAGANITWGSAAFNPTAFWLSASGLSGGQTLTLMNGIDLNGATRQVVDGTQDGGSVVLAGGIIDSQSSGAGIILNINRGTANIYLTGTSTYTGTTSIQGNNGCMVVLGGTGTGGTGSLASTAISIQNGGPQFGINLSGTTTLGAAISGSAGTSSNYSGNTLVQYGPGTVIYTGSNSYSGGTLITNGTMQIGNGGTTGVLSANSAVTGSSGTQLIFDNSGAIVVSNTLSGGMGVTQAGTGQLTMAGNVAGTNFSYTGTTTISSGTLQLGNGSGSDAVLSNSSNISNNGALVYNTNGTPGAYTGIISGAGSLTKIGVGTQILNGNNTYTGATAVNGGTLKLGGSNGNATAITIGSAGTLALTNSNAAAGSTGLTVNGGTVNLNISTSVANIINMAGNAGTGLTLSSGILNFGLGTNVADELKLGLGGVSETGTTMITFTTIGSGVSLSNQALIYAPGGGLVASDFEAVGVTNPVFTVVGSGGTTLELSTGLTITTAYWYGGSGVNWSGSNSFTSDAGGTTPTVGGLNSTLNVIFSATGATNQSATVLDQNMSVSSLTINDTHAVSIGGSNTLTIAGNSGITTGSTAGAATIGANVAMAGSSPVITVGNGANGLTINGVISGSNGISVQGGGLLVLNGTNTYSGGTTLAGGTTQINNANSLGASSGALAFSGTYSNTTLQLASGLGSGLADSRNVAFNNTTGTATINNNGNSLTLSGTLSGAGAVNWTGSGLTTLTGAANTNSGALTITTGTLQIGNNTPGVTASIGSPSSITDNGALAINQATNTNWSTVLTGSGSFIQNGSGTVTLTGNQNYTGQTIVNSGTLNMTSGELYSSNMVGTVVVNGGTFIDSGNGLFEGGHGSSSTTVVNVIVGGGGVFQLNNVSEEFHNLTLNGGTVTTNGGYNAQYNSLIIEGPTITVGGTTMSTMSQAVASANSNIRLSGSNTSSLDITTFNVGKTSSTSGTDLLVSANVEDGYVVGTNGTIVATELIKTGSGTMVLTGSNNWTGGTQINQGVLQAGSPNAIAFVGQTGLSVGTAVGSISFGGGTLQYSAASAGVDYSSLFSNAASQAYSVDTNGQSVTFASGLSSSGGSLTKIGNGTLKLTGTNTYNGGTTISGGTLQVGNGGTTGKLGTGSVVNNGALVYNVNNTQNLSGMSGSGSLTVGGGAVVNLSGTSTYSGATTVSNGGGDTGSLKLSSLATLGNTAITVNTGGIFHPGASAGSTGAGSLGASLTINGGTLDMTGDGVATTFDLNQQSSFAGLGLSGSNGTFKFDISGGSVDNIVVSGAAGFYGSDTITLNILGGLTSGTYNLISTGGGLSGAGNLTLSSTTSGFSNFSLASTSNAIELIVSGNAVPSVAYWTGKVSSIWSDGSTAPNSNWATDATGATDTNQLPGASTTVYFSTTSVNNLATPVSTTLGSDMAIAGLVITSGATGGVTIGGANTLTLSSGGLTIQSGAGALTINSTGVSLATGQTWNNSSSYAATISASISGTGSLTLTGASPFILSGSSTYDGGTTIDNGFVQIGTGTSLGTGAVTFTANGGTLQLAPSAGALSSANNFTLNGTATIDTNGAANSLAISGSMGGAGGINLINGGTLILVGGNIGYTGATTITSSTLQIGNGVADGSITGSIANNGALVFDVVSSASYANSISGAGSLTKSGNGTLTLTGNSSGFSGAVGILGGNVSFSNTDPLGTGTVTVSNSTATLEAIGNATTDNAMNLSGSTVTLAVDNSVTWIANGIFTTGNNTINKTGNGKLVLAGASNLTSLTMGTATANTGTVEIGNANAFTSGATFLFKGLGGTLDLGGNTVTTQLTTVSNATINDSVGGGLLIITNNGAGQPLNGQTGFAGSTATFNAAVQLGATGSAAGVYFGNNPVNNVNYTFNGPISQGAAGSGIFDYSTAGWLTLNGSDSFSGEINLAGGGTRSLAVGNSYALSTGVTELTNSGTFSASGAAAVDLLQGTVNIGNNNTFGTAGSGDLTFTIGALGAFSYTVTIDNNNTTINGNATIGGGANPLTFTKNGPGNLILGGNWNGGMTSLIAINQGNLQFGTGGSAGSFSVPTISGSAGTNLIFNRSDSGLNVSSTITGAVNVVQNGPGLTTLSGNVNTTGTTVVNAGTLVVSGAVSGNANVAGGTLVASGSIGGNVNVAGGTLAGGGTIAGNVTVQSGGTLAPGNGTDATKILNTGSVNLSGGTYSFTLSTTSLTSDQLNVNGTLTLGGTALLSGTDLGAVTLSGSSQIFVIAQATNIVGQFAGYSEGSQIEVGSNLYTISYGNVYADEITLQVPEPQTWALLAGGVGMLLGSMRNRRNRR